MKVDLLVPSQMFSVAELSAMQMNFEVFRFHNAYAAFWFVENADTRAKYLLLTTRRRARAKTATEAWVKTGGPLPHQLDLVDAR